MAGTDGFSRDAIAIEGRRESVRPRPPLFRALGAAEPPLQVDIAGASYELVRVFKHDSWAATALYAGATGQVVCKFNRQQRIGPIPMRWLGRLLARNERAALVRLDGLSHVPRCLGPVGVAGRVLRHAVAHEFIPGLPLGKHSRVDEGFFPALRALLDELHRRGLAYVDLHKRENVLVGADGRPYLIDFQISFVPPERWRKRLWSVRAMLRLLQRSDDYHYLKMAIRGGHDPGGLGAEAIDIRRPWWIRAHRLVARPFRAIRRRLLVLLRVRRGRGRATSEVFAEEAVRLELGRDGDRRDAA